MTAEPRPSYADLISETAQQLRHAQTGLWSDADPDTLPTDMTVFKHQIVLTHQLMIARASQYLDAALHQLTLAANLPQPPAARTGTPSYREGADDPGERLLAPGVAWIGGRNR